MIVKVLKVLVFFVIVLGMVFILSGCVMKIMKVYGECSGK